MIQQLHSFLGVYPKDLNTATKKPLVPECYRGTIHDNQKEETPHVSIFSLVLLHLTHPLKLVSIHTK